MTKKDLCCKVLAVLFWLLVWQVAAMILQKPLLLPSPVETVKELIALLPQAAFWKTVFYTCLRVMAGFLSAAFIGVLLAFLCSFIKAADVLFSPLIGLMRALPVVSVIILILLWTQRDLVPVFVSFLAVVPPVWSVVRQGLSQTDDRLLEMARCFRFGFFMKLRYIYLPSVKPYIFAGWSGNLGLAWKACIAAEVIARPGSSIGRNLQDAKIYLETPQLFAWTAVVILLSFLFERLLRIFFRVSGESVKKDI